MSISKEKFKKVVNFKEINLKVEYLKIGTNVLDNLIFLSHHYLEYRRLPVSHRMVRTKDTRTFVNAFVSQYPAPARRDAEARVNSSANEVWRTRKYIEIYSRGRLMETNSKNRSRLVPEIS